MVVRFKSDGSHTASSNTVLQVRRLKELVLVRPSLDAACDACLSSLSELDAKPVLTMGVGCTLLIGQLTG